MTHGSLGARGLVAAHPSSCSKAAETRGGAGVRQGRILRGGEKRQKDKRGE